MKKFTLLLACVALTACSGNKVRHALGFNRNSPDEFEVVSQPPLSVPPVYHLRPPSDAPRASEEADAKAKSLVLGTKEDLSLSMESDPAAQPVTAVTGVGESSLPSTGEETLLRNAGAPKAEADIRSVLERESQPVMTQEEENHWYDKFRFFKSDKDQPVVDAKKEQARIKANKVEGKPITNGKTAEIDPSKESVLDRIFK